jgi:pyruvate dehydrogenase E2 component (dihydrolipoyllysine-residue acetyltransferase)
MPDVVMPRLSDSMEEGTILKWLKADGDEIARGDELVEIETDKATMTYEADTAGTLSIVAQEGETLPIGQVIARIGDAGEAPAAAEAPAQATQQAEASGNGARLRRRPPSRRRGPLRPRPPRRRPRATAGGRRPRRSRGGSRASRGSTSPRFRAPGRAGGS